MKRTEKDGWQDRRVLPPYSCATSSALLPRRRSDPPWRLAMKFLVPVDGSDLALDAFRHALRLRRED